MKRKKKNLSPLWEEITPLLLSLWRKLMKLPNGPQDRLQSREFQKIASYFATYQELRDISTKEGLGAYFLYDWQLHYAEALSLLKEIPYTPTRVLEIEAKGAAFSLAALQHGASEVVAIDPQEMPLTYGAKICGTLGYPITTRLWQNGDPLPISGLWDLIILPYFLLSRFSTTEQQTAYIQTLLPLLSQNGYLLIVEAAHPSINQRFLALRDRIHQEKIPIAAPCLWQGTCPARQAKAPCFAQRILEKKPRILTDLERSLQLQQGSLKMSYLLLQPSHQPPKECRLPLYRIISPLVDTFKGPRFFLCGTEGKKTLGSTLTTLPQKSRAFSHLQRGDVITIDQAVSLHDDLQITENTTLHLYAPCDKPVP